MDVFVFRIRNFQGVIADYGPFTDIKHAADMLKNKGWTQKGSRSFVLNREDEGKELLEGDLRRDYHRFTADEIPSKQKEE